MNDGRLLTVFTNESREDARRPAPREIGCVEHLAFNVSRATFTLIPARLRERYDVQATSTLARATPADRAAMMRALLSERFNLVARVEPREQSVLALVPARANGSPGPGLKRIEMDCEAKRAADIGARVGALIDTRTIEAPGAIPFDTDHFDMIVIDDTGGRFASLDAAARTACLQDARRIVRQGGRVEIVEGGSRPPGYDALRELEGAGFKPVRLLAEREGFRFIEGLRAAAS